MALRDYFRFPWTKKELTTEQKVQKVIDKRNQAVTSNVVRTDAVKSTGISNILFSLKNTLIQVFGAGPRGTFMAPEWDFKKIETAFQNEAIFRRSVEKYVEQIRKHSWEFVGKNPNTVDYVRKRFKQIALVMNRTTAEFFDELAFNIVLFSNVLIVKRRNRKASGGNTRVTFDGMKRVPVAGYEVLDPSTVEVDKDKYGNVNRWQQTPQQDNNQFPYTRIWEGGSNKGESSPSWPSYNVVHVRDRTASCSKYFFSMPMSVPVIADMEALRELEELALIESIKVAIPKLHGKVGSKEIPGTQDQVDDLAATIRSAAGDGVIVTNERVAIEEIAQATNANNILTGSIDYFRERVLAGLGMSDVAMGKSSTSNRATAQVISSEMQMTSAKFQRILKYNIEHQIISELLYEGGYSEDTLTEDNMVYLSIPEVSLQEKITREAHHLNQYINNTITEDELRKELGRDVITDELRDNMYLNTVQIPLATEQAEASADAAIRQANATAQPANQHGKALVKPKVKKDYYKKLWRDMLAVSHDKKEILLTLRKSNLPAHDITVIEVLLQDYMSSSNSNEDSINNIFSALKGATIDE